MKKNIAVILSVLSLMFVSYFVFSSNVSAYSMKTQTIYNADHYYNFIYSNSTYNSNYYVDSIYVYTKQETNECATTAMDSSLKYSGYSYNSGETCKYYISDTYIKNPYIYYSNYEGGSIINARTSAGDGDNKIDTDVYLFRLNSLVTGGNFGSYAKVFDNPTSPVLYNGPLTYSGINFGNQTTSSYNIFTASDYTGGLLSDDRASTTSIGSLYDGYYVIAGGWQTYTTNWLGTKTDLTGSRLFTNMSLFVYDTTAPSVSAVPETSGYYTGDVQNVSVTVNGGLSPIYGSVYYQWSTSTATPTTWNTASTTTLGNSKSFEASIEVTGAWYLHVKTTDYAGNTTITHFGPYYIDNTAPSVSLSASSGETLVSSSSIVNTMRITVSATDNVSLAGPYQYCVSNYYYTCNDTWRDYSLGDDFSIGSDLTAGTHYLLVKKIYDNAGNYDSTAYMYYTQGGVQYDGEYSSWYYYTVKFDGVTYSYDDIAGTDQELIMAHAGGYVSATSTSEYLNCLECLEYNYANGTRLFELDLRLTTDGKIIATHMFENIGGSNSTYNSFLNYQIEGQYTTLVTTRIVDFLLDNPDAFIFIDTKESNKVNLISVLVSEVEATGYDVVLDRIVPYMFDLDDYSSLEAIHNFDQYAYTQYNKYLGIGKENSSNVVNFFISHSDVNILVDGSGTLDMLYDDIYNTLDYYGSSIFLFTVDSINEAESLFNSYSIAGVISNAITVNEMIA